VRYKSIYIRSISVLRFYFFNVFIIFLTAGMDDPSRPLMTLQKALDDDKRIRYNRDYLSNLSAAIRYSLLLQIH
jgi:beta-glucosidase